MDQDAQKLFILQEGLFIKCLVLVVVGNAALLLY